MVKLVCSYLIVNCEVSSTVVNPRLNILLSAKLAIPAMHHFLFIEYKISVSFRVLHTMLRWTDLYPLPNSFNHNARMLLRAIIKEMK